jgi:predicted O-methyltransferase YrrM
MNLPNAGVLPFDFTPENRHPRSTLISDAMQQAIIPMPLDLSVADRFLQRKPDWVKSDQTPTDAAALITMVRAARPKSMLEIGSSAGEGAAAMLYGAEDFGSKLHSLDLAQNVYYAKDKVIGAVIDESFPEYLPRYKRSTGVMCDAVRTLGERFEFVHIDGAHSHPWAAIDFLRTIPFLNEGALVAFHDANYMAAVSQAAYYVARILPGQFVGNHFLYCYQGPVPQLFEGLMDVFDVNWQQSIEPKVLQGLYEDLTAVFTSSQAAALTGRIMEKNASYLKYGKLYADVNGALWKRELERRAMLAAAT